MEFLLFILCACIFSFSFMLFLSKSKSSNQSSGPTFSTSSHPNAGLISFLDPEDCYNKGILPNKRTQPCGCVTYYDDLGASATECCEKCSEDSPF